MTTTVNEMMAAYETVKPAIRARFARRLRTIGQRFDLDDLCQEVALKAIKHVEQCRAETIDEIHHWLLTMAKNTAETAVTRNMGTQKRSTLAEECAIGDPTAESRDGYQPTTGEPSGLDGAILREQIELAVATLNRMSAAQKTAVTRTILEDGDYQEIAQEMGVSYSAVRTLVSRGIAKARKELAQE